MAEYIRNAILEMSEIDNNTLQTLTSSPFDKPMGYWPVVKYIRGKLIGSGDELAAKGNVYPFMRWRPTIKSATVDENGNLNMEIQETFTAELADGIEFRPQSYEVWKAG